MDISIKRLNRRADSADILLYDGMADYPIDKLGGKTPLDMACKPNIDALCKAGELGLVKTILSAYRSAVEYHTVTVTHSRLKEPALTAQLGLSQSCGDGL